MKPANYLMPQSDLVLSVAHSANAASGANTAGVNFKPSSQSVGPESQFIDQAFRLVQQTHSIVRKPESLEEKLFEARAAAKVLTAEVAMHFSRNDRDQFFSKIDRLLTTDEWDENDVMPERGTFRTLLRTLLFLRPKARPSIGLTTDGYAVAVWRSGNDRLTLECLPDDQIRWILSKTVGEKRESAAGLADITRLLAVLSPYDPMTWFSDGVRVRS